MGLSREAIDAATEQQLLERELAEFDPFCDLDNDPHVFVDSDGNAYVAGW